MVPDDIAAAFHQVFYHPCMMPIFASVFDGHLCIPAGSIFGSVSSPGFYMVVGELWAWAAGAIDFQRARVRLMLQTLFPQPPTSADIANFSQAAPDSFNPGAAALTSHGASALYPVFVDDTGNVNTRKKISDTVTASVLAAYLLFGFPGGDTWGHRPPCINAQKWPTHLRHQVTFLGFEIDTRAMTLTWPVDKRRRLQHRINVIKENARAGGQVPCKLLAQTLGLLRNGCLVLPLGSTLSLQTQYAVNDKVKAAFQGGTSPRKQCIFWDTARV